MSHRLEYSIWESPSERVYVNDTKELGKSQAGLWCTVPRLLGLELDKYVEMLVNDFNVDYIELTPNNVLIYSWKHSNYAAANKFKLWVNKKSREGQWFI